MWTSVKGMAAFPRHCKTKFVNVMKCCHVYSECGIKLVCNHLCGQRNTQALLVSPLFTSLKQTVFMLQCLCIPSFFCSQCSCYNLYKNILQPLASCLDILIYPWLLGINKPIKSRAGEEGGRTGAAKQKNFVGNRTQVKAAWNLDWGVDREEAIDLQSQSSGFHVSRCQVSAIGAAWKMRLCSSVMEQHRFRSVCASSRRAERHWFTTSQYRGG